MSKKSEKLEKDLTGMINSFRGGRIPDGLPRWMREEGIVPGAKILYADGIGSLDKKNKTDVIMYLQGSEPIKISAKLLSADHFGNWYGHKRFLTEFGQPAFERMTKASAAWANNWARTAKAPFVGVSICFGRRGGNTGQPFTDIFTEDDILTVAKGFGGGSRVANCMYIANRAPLCIPDLIDSLQEITKESVIKATSGFMVAHRPVNPMTSGTDRAKNAYCRFLPFERLPDMTTITNPYALFRLGRFVPVNPVSINHNHILDDLERRYNIYIPRKN